MLPLIPVNNHHDVLNGFLDLQQETASTHDPEPHEQPRWQARIRRISRQVIDWGRHLRDGARPGQAIQNQG